MTTDARIGVTRDTTGRLTVGYGVHNSSDDPATHFFADRAVCDVDEMQVSVSGGGTQKEAKYLDLTPRGEWETAVKNSLANNGNQYTAVL